MAEVSVTSVSSIWCGYTLIWDGACPWETSNVWSSPFWGNPDSCVVVRVNVASSLSVSMPMYTLVGISVSWIRYSAINVVTSGEDNVHFPWVLLSKATASSLLSGRVSHFSTFTRTPCFSIFRSRAGNARSRSVSRYTGSVTTVSVGSRKYPPPIRKRSNVRMMRGSFRCRMGTLYHIFPRQGIRALLTNDTGKS